MTQRNHARLTRLETASTPSAGELPVAITLPPDATPAERAARLTNESPVILLALDPHEAGYVERQAEIARWKLSGRTVAIIHQWRGYEVWASGQLVDGGIDDPQ